MSVVEQPQAPVFDPIRPNRLDDDRRDGGVVLALHLFGWGVLVFGVAPQHITLGSAGVFGVGLGVTAYLLGVRHAFDADHIAVIDNTTRKLVGEGTRSLSAGFWFSLGPFQRRVRAGVPAGDRRSRGRRSRAGRGFADCCRPSAWSARSSRAPSSS